MDLKKETIKSYNLTANEYQVKVSSFSQLPELTKFAKLMPNDAKVLDLGCGPGHHSKFFSDLGFDVTGIDLSQKMIDIAKREYKNVDFRLMDIEDLLFKENSFDGIWASASLLHIEKEKISKVLKKLKELLKNSGILYLSLKEGYGEEFINDSRYSNVIKFFSYYHFFEIEKFIRDCGFKIFDVEIVNQRNDYDTNSWIHIFCKK